MNCPLCVEGLQGRHQERRDLLCASGGASGEEVALSISQEAPGVPSWAESLEEGLRTHSVGAEEKLPEQVPGPTVLLVCACAVGSACHCLALAPELSGESVVLAENTWECGSLISWVFCSLPPVILRRMLWC